MITSPEVYPQNESISIVFNKEDSLEARLLSGFRHAFGHAYAMLEDLDAHRCCLHLRRGGLREVRR
jgi:hypothetical protein